jgi:hypothetical protein
VTTHAYSLSYLGSRGRRIKVLGQTEQKQESLSEKHTRSQRAGGATQVVEHLPSKHQALNSSPNTAKKKKKKKPMVIYVWVYFWRLNFVPLF